MERKTGFIDITNKYFDFHRSLFKPTLDKKIVYDKVHDDKLMEIKFGNKKELETQL